MLLGNSLTDEPNDIFKLFEYSRLVRGVQEELEESSGTRFHIDEVVLDTEEQSKPIEELKNVKEKDETCGLQHDEHCPNTESESTKQAKNELDERVLDSCLNLLSKEIIPDEELCKLPSDALKEVFPFFMKSSFQMPNIDETPLGEFLLKKKEEQIEDLTTFELEQMLNFALKENKILEIQNEVFQRFLKKNDPRFDKDYVKTLEVRREIYPEEPSLDISSAEMIKSKVVFPDVEDTESSNMSMEVLALCTRVVEHEIKEVHKEYEKELNIFTAKMKNLGAIQKSLNIHLDKITETLHLLNVLVVKKQKKKMSFELVQFAEFLKAAIKQDQQDLRRLRVLTYEYNKKIVSHQRKLKSHDRVRKVDLELYEIKSNELSTKLSEQNEEFLQLKKIFDAYQKRVDASLKKLEENRKLLIQNKKTFSKRTKDLEIQQTCYKLALTSLIEFLESVIHLKPSTSSVPGKRAK